MNKLKTTIKVHDLSEEAAKVGGKHRDPYRFIFSANLLDWVFSDTDYGKKKRKMYEQERQLLNA